MTYESKWITVLKTDSKHTNAKNTIFDFLRHNKAWIMRPRKIVSVSPTVSWRSERTSKWRSKLVEKNTMSWREISIRYTQERVYMMLVQVFGSRNEFGDKKQGTVWSVSKNYGSMKNILLSYLRWFWYPSLSTNPQFDNSLVGKSEPVNERNKRLQEFLKLD